MSEIGNLQRLLQGPLANLDWLEVDEEEYRLFEKLPKQNLNSIPELEDQWRHRHEESSFRLSPDNVPVKSLGFWSQQDLPSLTSEEDKATIVSLYRSMLEQGMDIKQANHRLKLQVDSDTLQDLQPRLRDVTVKEAGLLGPVYVDASLHPRCDQGEVRVAKSQTVPAQVVLAKSNCHGCIHNMQGRCAVFKKELVLDVEDILFENLLETYAPKMVGKDLEKFASLSPRKRLQAAMLAPYMKEEAPISHKPIMVDPSKGVSIEAARESATE